jgi:hypothetical protein
MTELSSRARAWVLAGTTTVLVLAASGLAKAEDCPEKFRWLADALPAQANIELLITTENLESERRELDRAMAHATVACAHEHSAITIRSITANAQSDPPVWYGVVPTANSNPFESESRRRRFQAGAFAVIDQILNAPHDGQRLGSDIIGAFQAAGQDYSVAGKGSHPVVIALTTGWQQSRDFNIFIYQGNPVAQIDLTLRKLRRIGGIPKLAGTDVYIGGLAPGDPRMGTRSEQLLGLCKYWAAITGEARAVQRMCLPVFPGVAEISLNDPR